MLNDMPTQFSRDMLWLACLGWDAVRPSDKLPLHIPSAPVYAQLHAG